MTLVAVENLRKARIKRFVKCFNALSVKKYLPVSFRVIIDLTYVFSQNLPNFGVHGRGQYYDFTVILSGADERIHGGFDLCSFVTRTFPNFGLTVTHHPQPILRLHQGS